MLPPTITKARPRSPAATVGFLLLILSARASAQDVPREPSSVDRLIAVQAVLHVADMFTTSYDLTYGYGREGNPLLRSFDRNTGGLTAAAGLLTLGQIWYVKKLEATHPKAAVVVGTAMVLLKTLAVASDINAMGTIEARRRGR
jgi:hypothetical protein